MNGARYSAKMNDAASNVLGFLAVVTLNGLRHVQFINEIDIKQDLGCVNTMVRI